MKRRYFKWVFLVSFTILSCTALAKLTSMCGHAPILNEIDPIFQIPNRFLMLAISIIELIIAGVLASSGRALLKGMALLWLGISFMIYRFGVWYTDSPLPCPCLGSVVEFLPLKPHTVTLILNATTCFFFLGGLTVTLLARNSKSDLMLHDDGLNTQLG